MGVTENRAQIIAIADRIALAAHYTVYAIKMPSCVTHSGTPTRAHLSVEAREMTGNKLVPEDMNCGSVGGDAWCHKIVG